MFYGSYLKGSLHALFVIEISNLRLIVAFLNQVACLSAETVGRNVEAFSYALVAMRGFELVRGHPDVEPLKVPFLQLSSDLASDLGQVCSFVGLIHLHSE